MAKACIYARTNRLDNSPSIVRQIAACEALAAREGLVVEPGDTYTDVSSGLSRPEDRPSFRDLVSALEPGVAVFVHDTSRIARHVSDFFRARDIIAAAGASLHIVDTEAQGND